MYPLLSTAASLVPSAEDVIEYQDLDPDESEFVVHVAPLSVDV
jgi:hypothetical protein